MKTLLERPEETNYRRSRRLVRISQRVAATRARWRASSALAIIAAVAAIVLPATAQERAIVLRPDRVYDGETMHEGWVVVVEGNRISAAGPAAEISVPSGAESIELPGQTLLPGLIEGHSHILLHPYNETSWTDQVLNESLGERTARAVNHVRDSLLAGVDHDARSRHRGRRLRGCRNQGGH